jgi:hypothetical protein
MAKSRNRDTQSDRGIAEPTIWGAYVTMGGPQAEQTIVRRFVVKSGETATPLFDLPPELRYAAALRPITP